MVHGMNHTLFLSSQSLQSSLHVVNVCVCMCVCVCARTRACTQVHAHVQDRQGWDLRIHMNNSHSSHNKSKIKREEKWLFVTTKRNSNPTWIERSHLIYLKENICNLGEGKLNGISVTKSQQKSLMLSVIFMRVGCNTAKVLKKIGGKLLIYSWSTNDLHFHFTSTFTRGMQSDTSEERL